MNVWPWCARRVGTTAKGGPVKANDMILVSVDDHLVEPPTMFEGRVPAKYADEAPKVVRTDDGADVWVFNGAVIPNIGLNAVAGRPREEYGIEPTAFEEMRPGCWNVDERIKDMNAGGILAAMNFPSFPGFAGRLFASADDKDMALAVLQAYNDWHLEEWCGAYPGRFIPMALPVLWDPELAAAEVRRMAEKGCHSLTFSENPAALGYPSYHEDYWDPLWNALCDTETILSVHLGSSGRLAMTAPHAPVDVMITLQPMNICQAAADILWSRVIKEFPALRIALSEGGTGWIPYFIDRLDRTYDMHRAWTGQDFGDQMPSEVFRERFLTCFITDPVGVKLRHDIGMDNIAWESDYPHSDSSWPNAADELEGVMAGVPDDEIDKITFENACRWYSFDPFEHRTREQCTVGALRAESAGHDVSVRSYDQGRFVKQTSVTIDDIASRATA
jgi:predicted TIM-barrel fold metal-dependent hydrolase